jgi:uncharacterized delta-60 repeat protein
MRKIIILNATLMMFASINLKAQVGIDNTFGTNGIVKTDFKGKDDEMMGMVLQQDEKILSVGRTFNGTDQDFAIARHSKDGVLDNTFGNGGKVTTDLSIDDEFNDVAIQADGKILAAGFSMNNLSNKQFTVVRYKVNGAIDSSFAQNGIFKFNVSNFDNFLNTVAIQADGKILLGGVSYATNDGQMIVLRLNQNGTLDNSFHTTGYHVLNVSGATEDIVSKLLIRSDGKIIVAGSSTFLTSGKFILFRLLTNGDTDPTFGNSGIVSSGIPNFTLNCLDAQLTTNEDIILAGEASDASSQKQNACLAKYSANGTLDNSFGNGTPGFTVFNISGFDMAIGGIALQPDGKIISVGFIALPNNDIDMIMSRININGSLDNTFGSGGIIQFNNISTGYDLAMCVALTNNGKIIIGGLSDYTGTQPNTNHTEEFCLIRYNTNGALRINAPINIKTQIYPNPARDYISINCDEIVRSVAFYSLQGQEVLSIFNSRKIDISTLKAGVYSLKIQLENGVSISKITKL